MTPRHHRFRHRKIRRQKLYLLYIKHRALSPRISHGNTTALIARQYGVLILRQPCQKEYSRFDYLLEVSGR